MNVTCSNDEVYSYLLAITIANSLPSVTVKQASKFNLFYLDGTAPLTITAGCFLCPPGQPQQLLRNRPGAD